MLLYNSNFSGLSGRARKHPSNVFTPTDIKNFDMMAGRSCGFFDGIKTIHRVLPTVAKGSDVVRGPLVLLCLSIVFP